jgi:murein DD-endopeptidase MepM/ murein hydrolase activator NlpD
MVKDETGGARAITRRRPQYLEIMVARSGHPARALRIPCAAIRKTLWFAGGAAALWLGSTAYLAASHWYYQDQIAHADQQSRTISALEARNAELASTRVSKSEHLVALQEKIDALTARLRELVQLNQQRFPEEKREQVARPAGVGGVAIPLSAASAGIWVNEEIQAMEDRLALRLPDLEYRIGQELARPMGNPIAASTQLSSLFGFRRNPFGRGSEFHNGVDFAVPSGTPVLASAPGTVREAGYDPANGNHVEINHGYGYRTVYCHLSRIDVKSGSTVAVGQTLGAVGSTGRSSGPHLHYTIYYQDRAVDPQRYLVQHTQGD